MIISTQVLVALLLPAANAFTVPQSSIQRHPNSFLCQSTATAPSDFTKVTSEINDENPLRVLIAGAGVGGLSLANSLSKYPHIHTTVLERTDSFKRFGGPIQLASNALEVLKTMDQDIFDQIESKFTITGDKENGIKDGIRTEWYAKFDLMNPAIDRNMPFTGVIERPDLQQIYLDALPEGMVQNGDGVATYVTNPNGHGLKAILESGKEVEGDVLIGADGIWSAVRSTMRDEPAKGEGSGTSYSGYTVFAGELAYDSVDNGKVGYKVYIGPGQYFVITDIGKGNYQWYAFLARPPGSADAEDKPDGSVPYLKDIFVDWSPEIHHILDVTKEHEIAQRDLYDRPPSVFKPWTKGEVALLGDSIHAMMPNLGQGGCQAIEDAYVINQELSVLKSRESIEGALKSYRNRRLIRSASVQGLSRFASDIIIRGFATPAKISFSPEFKVENFNYAGIVTRMLQPILPVFFWVQFNFLYDGWENEGLGIDLVNGSLLALIGGVILAASAGGLELGALLGSELEVEEIATGSTDWLSTVIDNIEHFFNIFQ